MHSDLIRKAVRFPSVARAACGHDVGPLVGSTARQWNEMVARERLARLELDLHPPAVLTTVAITREKKRVRHLAAETAGDVNEPREANDGGARQSKPFRAHYALRIGLHYLGLSVDHQPEGAPHGHHRQGLERCIQCKTTYDQALLQFA